MTRRIPAVFVVLVLLGTPWVELMTPAQLAEAQKLAREWKAAFNQRR